MKHHTQFSDRDVITMAHGAGGEAMHRLLGELILPRFGVSGPERLDDAAEIVIAGSRLAFSTDTFVVNPPVFPGGDIGSLAVSGTVNDLLMKGSKPLCLSLGFVLEEGFPLEMLARILDSIHSTCRMAGVRIITGDTKVVPRGNMGGVFINTGGIGSILPRVQVSGCRAQSGDKILVSGVTGLHGFAVMAVRNGITLAEGLGSDAAPLNSQVIPLLEQFPEAVHVLRDPTRGGLAATLNEIALQSNAGIRIFESMLPEHEGLRALCELLGLDPLTLPSEGRFLAIVAPDHAENIKRFLQENALCPDAAVMGEVTDKNPGRVILTTKAGGDRIVDMPAGELIPRIC
jgi:hydrogenase expression/formation protein HypE